MSRLHRTLTGLVAVLAATALLGTGSALASSMTASNGALTYTAATGEANHVTFWFDTRYGVFVIQDTGVASINVSGWSATGCQSYTPQIAWCGYGRVTSVTARLGNGGSFAQSKLMATPVTFYAGAGDDTLIGGAGPATLVAAAGNDTLTAGTGNTRLVGGTGSTTMTGGSGHNVYEGGSGADTINARNGVAEGVTCSAGADSVTADAGDSTSADCEAVDRGTPTTSTVVDPGTTPAPTPIDPGLPVFTPPVPVISTAPVALTAANAVPVAIGCPAAAAGGCRGVVSLAIVDADGNHEKLTAARRIKRRAISRGKRFRIAAGDEAVVPVVLSRRGGRYVRGRIARRRKVRVAVTVAMRSEAGTQRTTRTVTVHSARRSGAKQSGRRRRR